jgi:protein SCO1/2
MNRMRIARWPLICALALVSGVAFGQGAAFDAGRSLGIDQRLGDRIALDATFFDEAGREAPIGSYLGKRPAILMLIFYNCKGVCTQELVEIAKTLKAVKSASIGRDFDVITVSIHPKETPALAAQRKQEYLAYYNRPGAADGWRFLTGRLEQIRKLAASVGYRYTYDPVKDLVRHPAGIFVLTPDGRVSRVIYGIEYPSKQLRDALAEAGRGKIGPRSEPLLLGCLQVDPATGRVTVNVINTLKAAGIATVIILFGSIALMSWRERASRSMAHAPGSPGGAPSAR